MAFKTKLFLGSLVFILLSAWAVYYLNNQNPKFDKTSKTYIQGVSPEIDQAIANAKAVYAEKAKVKTDFSSGPCLTNDLMPGWVADTVHNPRQSIDDIPANQCQAYVEGRAKHFVELDLQGNLVRVH